MSATRVRSSSTVRAGARSVVYVSGEIVNALMRVTANYGLLKGCLIDSPEAIPKGLMVWLAARQLAMVVLELFGPDGRLLRKFELPIDYQIADDDEEYFQSQIESLEQFLKRDRARATRYEVHCKMNTKDYIRVPGWSTCSAADDSHLQRHQLSDELVSSKHLRVGLTVFTGKFIESGDESCT